MAISAIGEGCGKQVQPILGNVVNEVLPFCRDTVGDRIYTIHIYTVCTGIVYV